MSFLSSFPYVFNSTRLYQAFSNQSNQASEYNQSLERIHPQDWFHAALIETMMRKNNLF